MATDQANELNIRKFDEDRIGKLMEKRALRKCDEYTKAFSACSSGRLLSIFWACKEQWQGFQDCLKQYNNPEVFEAAKEQFIRDGQQSGIAEHGGDYNPFPDSEWLDKEWYKSRKRPAKYQSSSH